mgnify:CR=1 FL=1
MVNLLLEEPLKSYDQVVEILEKYNIPYTKLAKDWQGNFIIATKVKSDVLITAGAHGDEHAGVVSSINLAIEGKHIVIPARDPAGVNGFIYALKFLLDKEVKSKDYAYIIDLIKRNADWYHQSNEFIVGIFGNIALCAMPPIDPWKGEDLINEVLQRELDKDERLREKLEGMRIIMPANLPYSEGVDLFDRAFTSFVINGRVENYNSLFDIPDEKIPYDFKKLKEFINKISPKAVFDLHEGFGDKFYAFVPVSKEEFNRDYDEIFRKIKAELLRNGLKYLTVKEALNELPKERVYAYNDEREIAVILHFGKRCRSLSCYAYKELGAFSITFETGLKARFKERVMMSYIATKTAISSLNLNS